MPSIRAKSFRAAAAMTFAILAMISGGAIRARAAENDSAASPHPDGSSSHVDLPLSFEPNRGQSEKGVLFVARGPGYSLLLTEEGASFQFSPTREISSPARQSSFGVRLAGVKRPSSRLLGWDELASKTSYFTGSNPNDWLTGIPNFARVGRRSVYDGIDVMYHGIQGQLECEFKLAPHARPEKIVLEMLGARNLRKDARGDLVFMVADVEMRLRKPVAYQEVNGSIKAVTSHYVVTRNLVTLELGRYDSGKALVIDPVLSYSGYLKLQEAESLPASLMQSISPRSTSTGQFTGEAGHKPSRHINPMENF